VIREIDEGLERWVAGVVGEGVAVSFGTPAEQGERAVGLYLLSVAESPPPSGTAPAPLQVELRYLITAHAKDPKVEHELFESLIFAAMERADVRVELNPLAAGDWLAFKVAPRPSFSLCLPLRRERRVHREAKRVLHPLTLKASQLTPISGRVVGPGDIPFFDAEVELVSTGALARTDGAGKFEFTAAPASGEAELIVRAKGRTKRVRAPTGQPLLIRFDSLED
jgi:hypothetical protein